MSWNPIQWISDSRQFLLEVRTEFRKITWPTQKEATAGTIGVLVVVSVLTTGLATVDFTLGWVLGMVLP